MTDDLQAQIDELKRRVERLEQIVGLVKYLEKLTGLSIPLHIYRYSTDRDLINYLLIEFNDMKAEIHKLWKKFD